MKLRLSVTDVLVDDIHVRCHMFIQTTPDGKFVRCGELTLTPAEGAELQRKLSA